MQPINPTMEVDDDDSFWMRMPIENRKTSQMSQPLPQHPHTKEWTVAHISRDKISGDLKTSILSRLIATSKIYETSADRCGGTNTSNIPVARDKFTVTSGSPKSYTKRHEDGFNLTVFFCGDCGTAVYKQADAEMFSTLSLVQSGTLDGSPKDKIGRPVTELNVKLRPSWLVGVEAAAQKQGFV
ncbi:hypothetical protein Trco_007880 [Trichoderma cornu-damae]|uniref:CENP-V/GFA domain-containing protein n=1 Tax=Trichoderma cornu-damae TaxID=654480 RepID=A0A9P8TUR0_9HYPO|nr:hypothetical protein Trco_007880 [Trichoderma cornu-damae]